MNFLFIINEEGAVTVDWVVLTAGLVGLGLAAMSVVSTGVQDTSDEINGQLSTRHIATTMMQFEQPEMWDASLALEESIANFSTVSWGDGRIFTHGAASHLEWQHEQVKEKGNEYLQTYLNARQKHLGQLPALQALNRDSLTASDIALAVNSDEATI